MRHGLKNLQAYDSLTEWREYIAENMRNTMVEEVNHELILKTPKGEQLGKFYPHGHGFIYEFRRTKRPVAA